MNEIEPPTENENVRQVNQLPSISLRLATIATLLALTTIAGCSAPAMVRMETSERIGRAPEALHPEISSLRLDQLQVIGSHNSYKLAMQPELQKLLRTFSREADAVDYSHIAITDQLNLGLRNLELDIVNDPEGGRYANPLGNKLLKEAGGTPWPYNADGEMNPPGFKVTHDTDFDFRSSTPTLAAALAELRAWSEANPGHVPIFITFNCKQGKSRVPGGVDALDFDEAALQAFDAALIAGLGSERILTPDAVRGNAPTLRAGVLANRWPTVEAVAGKFILILDEGGSTRQRYLDAFPGLRGASLFTTFDADHPEAAIFVINEPIQKEREIADLTARGFLVRTRADEGTTEVRLNDFTRFEAAKRSGAQIITTDYYIPDRKMSDRYVVRFDTPLSPFVRPRPEATTTRP